VSISWLNAFIPFTGSYRPMWLGLGAVAGDLLIALIITSLLRKHIGYRVWRAVHWLAYACWPTAVLHGLTIGSDRRSAWGLGVTFTCVAAVGAAALWRPAQPRPVLRPPFVGAQS
jgi:methionine sulfoxide reductase heme-binding subunit